MNAQLQNEPNIEREVQNYSCQSCAAQMRFEPSKGMMVCDYCGTTAAMELDQNILARDLDFDIATASQWKNEAKVLSCTNCGAKTYFDSTDIAKNCAFCGSAKIVATEDMQGLKPQALIPFSINQQEATQKFHKWVKKRLFTPNKYKEYVTKQKVNGVYSPSWTFDTNTYSTYSGVVGDYYTVRVKTKDGWTTRQEIRWRKVSGNYFLSFADIFIESSPHITQKEFSKILPFDTHKAVAFDQKYLLGFTADHYDKELPQAWAQAREIINTSVKQAIVGELRCDVVQKLSISTNYAEKKYKYVLVPIYVGGTKYKDKLYNFFLNGTNGKATGCTPVSGAKLALLMAGFAVLVVLGGLFLSLVLR